jgi:flagellar hook-associated protein 1 FlgK
MPISSFYGMQTALRGLTAQQRMLDTTGHNIANASTQGYSRQEATLAASQALQLQAGGSATASGAHLGAGVDVQGFRRIRDQFLDLQFRGQNTSLNEWSSKASALDTAEMALAEPGDNGINAKLTQFWSSWSDLVNHPTDSAAKTVVVQKAGELSDSVASIRSQMVAAQQAAQGQYDSITGPGGDVAQISSELAGLNKTISSFISNGDAPNDLMDRRDVLLDKLSTFGQVSVEQLDSGSQNVSFVDSVTGVKYPIVADTAASWSGPPAGDWSPGGQLGGLQSAGKSPGGTIDGYLATIDSFAANLADSVNAAYGGTFFTHGTPAGATLDVAAPIQAAPASIRSGSGDSGSNDIALAVSKLSGSSGIDGVYKAFVAKVGSDLNEATRMTSNAQVLVNSVEDRRQSVSGVSMDEEMSNLVKFQRAYQASARAMSTMDEMLDVLINRTGKVGL